MIIVRWIKHFYLDLSSRPFLQSSVSLDVDSKLFTGNKRSSDIFGSIALIGSETLGWEAAMTRKSFLPGGTISS